jgi:hypothetical protein
VEQLCGMRAAAVAHQRPNDGANVHLHAPAGAPCSRACSRACERGCVCACASASVCERVRNDGQTEHGSRYEVSRTA